MYGSNSSSSSRNGTDNTDQADSRRVGKSVAKQPSESPDNEENTKKIVEVACWACRKRTGKCTGERPTCASCVRRDLDCTYEYEEGLTRVGSLRLKLDQAIVQGQNLQLLFEQLRTRSDNEAACLLAIIRLGVNVDVIVEKLRHDPDLAWASSSEFSKML